MKTATTKARFLGTDQPRDLATPWAATGTERPSSGPAGSTRKLSKPCE
jgi:hypothetical protein